ncbi:hypothetical protein [Pseudomonas aeruginosa]|uniref:hypothetical protein n=1 Tax=Pseudomonas aeruginosa TaxID=287 RepID=UPI000936A7E9|nr:hypothetical protein [Pseudomonas aeruginosa]MBG4296339.1 hypothetical protein [Pseudomonas aeruginosa]MBH9455857.1 hypothetical protein [Pseudomonas aeruginosa]MBH9464051.1 hypothetical protein [Pseudomonas aeruginosa]MBN0170571.1 hypothetical protein [Pseudomonas aeruginosa]MCO3738299.1 hypothetical protein [Pseudomonas aeruginosa]
MDYSPIVSQVWGMLAWFIPAALLIGLLKSPWAKGQIGELLVRLFAHWQLDKQTYRRSHKVTLNTPDGTTQIDRRAPSFATQREHLQNLKRRSNPTAERQCPKCGNALLIRTMKTGPKAGQQFRGGEVPKISGDTEHLRL